MREFFEFPDKPIEDHMDRAFEGWDKSSGRDYSVILAIAGGKLQRLTWRGKLGMWLFQHDMPTFSRLWFHFLRRI